MKVIDNVMPLVMQNQLVDSCVNNQANFGWSLLLNPTYADGDLHKSDTVYPSFSHIAYIDYRPNSNVAPVIASSLLCISDAAEQDPGDIFRVRFGLYLPIANAPEHNTPHTDLKIPHTTVLYYVNDCDGDTFFFDNDGDIIDRVTPKKGRLVVFDGLTSHASSMPSKNCRVSLNINYVNPRVLNK